MLHWSPETHNTPFRKYTRRLDMFKQYSTLSRAVFNCWMRSSKTIRAFGFSVRDGQGLGTGLAAKCLNRTSPCFSPPLASEAGRLLEDEGFGNRDPHTMSYHASEAVGLRERLC